MLQNPTIPENASTKRNLLHLPRATASNPTLWSHIATSQHLNAMRGASCRKILVPYTDIALMYDLMYRYVVHERVIGARCGFNSHINAILVHETLISLPKVLILA